MLFLSTIYSSFTFNQNAFRISNINFIIIIFMIKLSTQEIVFDYLEGKHLTTTLIITNPNPTSYLYFKMKVSRQKYFMVKPDKGNIPPRASTTLEITLHKEISTSCEDDQLQLMYTTYDKLIDKFPLNLFAEGQPYEKKRLNVKVRGAPSIMNQKKRPNENDFMSVVTNNNDAVFSSGNIQTLIQEAENRVRKLQQDVQTYRGMAKTNSVKESIRKKSKLPTVILSLVSLGIGYVVGFFV